MVIGWEAFTLSLTLSLKGEGISERGLIAKIWAKHIDAASSES
jgi:hypothetical protein